jgi:hypothetical protein
VAAEASFMELGGEDASDAGMSDLDMPIRMYEASFPLPVAFVEETVSKVVLASVVRRTPDVRQIELTPIELVSPENTPEAVIEFYLDQATKTTPRAFSVQIIDQPEEQRQRGPKPSQWESRLLQPIA